MKRMLIAVVVFLVATYLGVGGILWAFQDRLIFPAPGGIGADALDAAAAELGATPVALTAADGTALYAWHLGSNGTRAVLYFHGNGEALSDYIPLYRVLMRNGWDVFAVSYRGYPGSAGNPSEPGLLQDADAAWAWAATRYPPHRIVVHGRSLGGGVAAGLVAGDANPAALVLESTFGSLVEVASSHYPMFPVGSLLRSRFDTTSLAPLLGVPVLLLHSKGDEVVPIDFGARRLAPRIAEVELVEVEGYPHNVCLPVTVPAARKAYLAFLDRVVPR